jgi:hypothetical protein
VTPLWLWLKLQGFSDGFRDRALVPVLTVLFVTKKGLMKHSAQAVLNRARPFPVM